MREQASLYFLLFLTYAVIGWCMEVTVKKIQFGRFINRGFLIGPYCPIYGVGAVLITLLLKKYLSDPPALFVMGMVICSILEYSTSWIMEKLFHARWWDYSTKKFNLNGRICLDTMIPFGLLGLTIMYGLNPLFFRLYARLTGAAREIVCMVLFAGFAADVGVSVTILSHIRHDNKVLDKDNTEEMAAKVRAAIAARGWAHRRLLDAFPGVKHIGEVLKENAEEARERLEEKRDEAKERIEEKRDEARERIVETREKLSERREQLESDLALLDEAHKKYESEFAERRRALEQRLSQLRDRLDGDDK